MPRRLTIIEDSDEDFQAILRTLDRADSGVAVDRFREASAALEALRDAALGGTLPDVILLDLSLPDSHGLEVLAEIKADEAMQAIPVIVISATTDPTEVFECYRAGASGFCTKPTDRVRFDETIRAIDAYWLRSVTLPSRAYLP